jgi:hypothetical protein
MYFRKGDSVHIAMLTGYTREADRERKSSSFVDVYLFAPVPLPCLGFWRRSGHKDIRPEVKAFLVSLKIGIYI